MGGRCMCIVQAVLRGWVGGVCLLGWAGGALGKNALEGENTVGVSSMCCVCSFRRGASREPARPAQQSWPCPELSALAYPQPPAPLCLCNSYDQPSPSPTRATRPAQDLLDDPFLQPPRKSQESELRKIKSDAEQQVGAGGRAACDE